MTDGGALPGAVWEVLDSSNELILTVWSRENRLLHMNAGARRVSSDAYQVGRTLSEILGPEHEDEAAGFNAVVEEAFRTGQHRVFDSPVPQPGASEPLWVTTHMHPRGDRLIAISVDITDRVRAEQESIRAREQFQHALERSPVPTAVTRMHDGSFRLANDALLTQLGWTREEVIGRNAADLQIWADLEQRALLVERIRVTGHIDQFQTKLRRRDGTVFDCLVSSEALEFGGEQCLMGLYYDISDRVRAEEALRTSQAHLRAFLDNLPSPAYLRDLDERLLVANEASARLWGHPLDELTTMTMAEALPADGYAAAVARDARVVASGAPVEEEVQLIRADGQRRWMEALRFPVIESGEVVAIGGITTDITDRKERDAALEQAGEDALESSRLKSEFLATMSHEIRTPMNAVIGMAGLLLGSELDEQQREYAEAIRSSGGALLTLLNDILDLSKIEAGQLELEAVPVDVATLVNEVVELFAPSAHSRGLRLDTTVHLPLPRPLLGDPGRLRQVLVNILGNAIKFTESGHIDVEVWADPPPAVGPVQVCFKLRDTGVGMDAHTIGQLFETFRQADASTTRRFGGTGLGLAIVRRLVDRMGGRVEVESELGQGSTFTVVVALDRGGGAEPHDFTDGAPEADSTPSRERAGRRVLIVDDNALNLRLATLLLEQAGYQVDEARNGLEAVEAVTRGSYHAVLMDCEMPVMDGYTASRTIRDAEPPGARLPIVAVTASAMPGDAERAYAAGMDAHVTKPIDIDRLHAVLEKLIGATTGAS